MGDPQRVYVTGMSAITALGADLNTIWAALKSGQFGISPVQHDTKYRRVNLAGHISQDKFDQFCPRYNHPKADRSTILALNAVHQLVQTVPLTPHTGVILGTGFGVTHLGEGLYREHFKNDGRIPPHTITSCMENVTASQVAMAFGFHGFNTTLFTACSSGTNAIGLAYRMIKHGFEDQIVVIGVDSSISPVMLEAWAALRAVSLSEDPETASRPFSANRSGLVVGEGIGVLVLESEKSMVGRGGVAQAEIAGYSSNCDAGHITQSDTNFQTEVMRRAITDAEIPMESVQLISAHGTATAVGDRAEAEAINTLFDHAPPVHALKSQLGHTIGASGTLETIASIMMMNHNYILPTPNYLPSPDCPINVVKDGQPASIAYALKNSFGFGGNNASLVLRNVTISNV